MFGIETEIGAELLEAPYNHVHHARALYCLERARVAFLEHIGCPLQSLLDQQLFLVVTSLSVTYKRELVAGKYQVTCSNPTGGRKTLSLEQKILNAKSKPAVEAVVELMCLCGSTRRAVPLPERLTRALAGTDICLRGADKLHYKLSSFGAKGAR